MNETAKQRTLRQMIDEVSDTSSWENLAKELSAFAGAMGNDNPGGSTQTLEMLDLERSLQDRQQG